MAKYLRATVDFADLKKGECFYAYTIPEFPIERWIGYEGQLYYEHEDVVLLSTDMYEEVFITFEDAKNFNIKETDVGVQNEEDFFSVLGLNSWELDWSRYTEFENRTKCKFFVRWLCTDTLVGKGILEIDGEDVAFFHQSARKNDCNYRWFSDEAKIKAYNFAKEFIEKDEMEYNDVLKGGENLVNFFM